MANKIIGSKYVRKEAGNIFTIQKVFDGIPINRQFCIGSHRIDLYFPEHKLAIECSEYNHEDRDTSYKINRQKFVDDQLNCKFVHSNPDAEDFMTERILNRIFQFIHPNTLKSNI